MFFDRYLAYNVVRLRIRTTHSNMILTQSNSLGWQEMYFVYIFTVFCKFHIEFGE